MARGLGAHDTEARPPMTRSRSHTLPANTTSTIQPSVPAPIDTRPAHGRSSSYLSPAEPKPRNANTLPTEKTSRIHIPGTSHRQGRDRSSNHKHRYTQSHVETHSNPQRRGANGSLTHLVAGIAAERDKRQGAERQVLENSHNGTHHIKQAASYRTHRGGQHSLDAPIFASADYSRPYRATSDLHISPEQQRAPKTQIEIALERADAQRNAAIASVTASDIQHMQQEQHEADEELRIRLADVGSTSIDITRRLDYTYYALLEKVGNLVGTIQSFQSLSTQSKQLIENFTSETTKLDEDIKRRLRDFRNNFNSREAKVDDLETRGRVASVKARDLGRRLENARIIVGNWERREEAAQRKWIRVWGGLWWSFIALLILVTSLIIAKEWWFRGDPVAAGLRLPRGGSSNASLCFEEDEMRKVEVPEAVMKVLDSIEERRANRKIWPGLPEAGRHDIGEDARLRLLDEL